MRHDTPSKRSPVASQATLASSTGLNHKRRGFLVALSAGGAGAAAVTAPAWVASLQPSASPDNTKSIAQGYQHTEHVRRYYRTAKV